MERTGLNRFHISVKKWVETTNAIGIVSKTGRYGGTYAHRDIAFHFANWISPRFQLYIIKEYQRLKEIESNELNVEWDVRRFVTKANYEIHTNAVKEYIIPNSTLLIKEGLSKSQRHKKLKKAAEEQLNILNKNDRIKAFKKLSETTYIEAEKDAKP